MSEIGVGSAGHLPAASERLAGLDGLRALAVIGVLLFHAELSFARGGFLGVDLFFVLSGFLITGLLIREIERTGRLAVGQFYLRRARRLLPALLAMIVLVAIATAWLAPDALSRLRKDTLASLVYLTNWRFINAGESYFELTGSRPLLQHLWSLAIEEQFYLIWPLCALVCVRRMGRRALALLALALGTASAVWMAVLATALGYPEQGDPSRLYFGTDTHASGLLIGAALAGFWRPERLSRSVGRAARSGIVLAGVLAYAATCATFVFLGEQTAWLYPGGLLLSALLGVGLIMAATHPATRFGTWLDWAPMRWIGERSYGIYLWHWPICMMTRPGLDLPLSEGSILALRVVLTVGIAALSYRYLEVPVRQGAIGRFLSSLRAAAPRTRRRLALRSSFLSVPGIAAMTVAAIVLATAPSQTQPAADVLQAMGLEASPMTELSTLATEQAPDLTLLADVTVPAVHRGDLTAIGDSVLLGTRSALERAIRGALTDAQVGRQAAQVVERVKELRLAKGLAPKVLVHLGSNGYVTEKQLRQILELLADRERVILVNSHVPRRWMDPNNELIARVLGDYPNAVLADWREVSRDRTDFFVSDGIHLTTSGQRALINEILRVGDFDFVPTSRSLASLSLPLPERSVQPLDFGAPLDPFWHAMAHCEAGPVWPGLLRDGVDGPKRWERLAARGLLPTLAPWPR